MKWVVGVGGSITTILFALGTLADFHSVTNFAIFLLGQHTEPEWTEMTTNFIVGGVISLIFTFFAFVVASYIEGVSFKR